MRVGFIVGLRVGLRVGMRVGLRVGLRVGWRVGLRVGVLIVGALAWYEVADTINDEWFTTSNADAGMALS